ncbi:MAG: hypothetical protein M0R80_18640 [Proteobacteria bacterium]|jgi:hypothetical protein|nr:hypothetical protein [Pseudomonadota bacterium]
MTKLTNFRAQTLLVFLTVLCCLMLELILSKIASFHLGQSYSYIAIPITFLGLALGSFHAHLNRRIIENFDVPRYTLLFIVVTALSLAAMFSVFLYLFPVYSESRANALSLFYLCKTLVFIATTIVPFYFAGRILAVTYFINRENIGKIYSADLWGASTACFVTPLLFHFFDLPDVLFVVVVCLSVLGLIFRPMTRVRRLAVAALLVLLCFGFRFFMVHAEENFDVSGFEPDPEVHVTQLAHRWNEFSRVALTATERNGRVDYAVKHDNARSNVHVWRYIPANVRPSDELSTMNAPFIIGRKARTMMVMFAGCGAEMIRLNELAGGRSDITGVELNPLVRDLVLQSDVLEDYRIPEFLSLPNIHLVIQEGRHFLAEGEDKFDLIYMGSDAATGERLTVYSRKYLDSVEAYVLYLKRLEENGVFVIYHKNALGRIPMLRAAYESLGGRDFGKRVIIVRSPDRGNTEMFFSWSEFTPKEVDDIVSRCKPGKYRVRYAPGYRGSNPGIAALVNDPVGDSKILTDDKPYFEGLALEKYSLNPEEGKQNFLGWVRITTFLIITLVSLLLIVGISVPRRTRLPASVLFFLLATGLSYMLCEIALMAKLELFLQVPLLSMAVVLSVFLLAGGVGSRLSQRYRHRLDMRVVPVVAAFLVFGSIFLVDAMNVHLIGLPTPVKLVLAALAVFPVGICLGLFYPFAVTSLVKHDLGDVVPITYGVSTLASVIGANYAITFMVEVGFNSLLKQAAVVYLGLTVFVALSIAFSKLKLLRA